MIVMKMNKGRITGRYIWDDVPKTIILLCTFKAQVTDIKIVLSSHANFLLWSFFLALKFFKQAARASLKLGFLWI